MTPPRRHILIFHQAALGDFITTWPLAMALGRVFAQSRVMYVTGADKGRLAEDVIGVEGLSADAGWHTLYGEGTPPESVLKILRGTQCVVMFAENDEPAFVASLGKHAGDVPLIHVRPKPPPGVHVLEHQLAQLDGDGKLAGYVRQMQTLLRTTGLGRRSTPAGDTVLIHPGSGSPTKNWPFGSFVDVAKRLREAGREVSFVIGEAERERLTPGEVATLRATAPVIEPAGLVELKSLIARSTAWLGNDSGPTHLAAALGLRTVALFGPASAVDQWRPVGPNVMIATFDETPEAIVSGHLSRVRTGEG